MDGDLLDVLRALVNAAFATGGINDQAQTDLLGKLDALAQPAPAPAPAPPADEPAPDVPAEAGTEGTGFDG